MVRGAAQPAFGARKAQLKDRARLASLDSSPCRWATSSAASSVWTRRATAGSRLAMAKTLTVRHRRRSTEWLWWRHAIGWPRWTAGTCTGYARSTVATATR
eukprot:3869900-Prymnesium_polylepis.1